MQPKTVYYVSIFTSMLCGTLQGVVKCGTSFVHETGYISIGLLQIKIWDIFSSGNGYVYGHCWLQSKKSVSMGCSIGYRRDRRCRHKVMLMSRTCPSPVVELSRVQSVSERYNIIYWEALIPGAIGSRWNKIHSYLLYPIKVRTRRSCPVWIEIGPEWQSLVRCEWTISMTGDYI